MLNGATTRLENCDTSNPFQNFEFLGLTKKGETKRDLLGVVFVGILCCFPKT